VNRELKEYKLYEPIKKYFERKGFAVYPEVPMFSGCVDIGLIKKDIVMAIEMKMALSKKLIYQAYTHKLYADYVYLAIPTKPRDLSVCIKQGFGIIRVVNDKIEIILEPIKSNLVSKIKDKFINNCQRCGTEGIAGLPMLKGEGPAIECSKRVKKYLEKNPNATWKEIFKNVANHYSNYNSMCSALSYLVNK
jgi:hypothetical protein